MVEWIVLILGVIFILAIWIAEKYLSLDKEHMSKADALYLVNQQLECLEKTEAELVAKLERINLELEEKQEKLRKLRGENG